MYELKEKVSYLKGLCEGLSLDESKAEAKLLVKIIDILDEISEEIICINEYEDELQAQIDEIYEDLADVEEYLWDEEDDYCDDFDCEDYVCPACGETIYLDSDLLEDEEEFITCPGCGAEIELERDCCDCGCDCDCE